MCNLNTALKKVYFSVKSLFAIQKSLTIEIVKLHNSKLIVLLLLTFDRMLKYIKKQKLWLLGILLVMNLGACLL